MAKIKNNKCACGGRHNHKLSTFFEFYYFKKAIKNIFHLPFETVFKKVFSTTLKSSIFHVKSVCKYPTQVEFFFFNSRLFFLIDIAWPTV